MKHLFALTLLVTLLGGCQRFVEFDRDLLDGGDAGKSLGAVDPLDGGVGD